MDHPEKLTHLSLCTGYGGIDIGLQRALGGAIRCVAYVEIEAFAVSNLVAKVENGQLDAAPIHSDLKRFPWRSFRGRVDILSGGFPCQPFSSAGRRAGDEDPRHLFPYILDGLRELGKPPLVFLENVEGIISSKLKGGGWSDPEGTPVLLHVLRELERVGYDATAGVFSAREIGAPHQRKRVFILGCRLDLSDAGRALVSGMLDRWGGSGVYPAPRGADQHTWEPPRVTVGDALRRKQKPPELEPGLLQKPDGEGEAGEPQRSNDTRRRDSGNREAQPAMGGNADGASGRVDYAKLCCAVDNRTDELRLLGNGVVPDTAARAFRELWQDVGHALRGSAR